MLSRPKPVGRRALSWIYLRPLERLHATFGLSPRHVYAFAASSYLVAHSPPLPPPPLPPPGSSASSSCRGQYDFAEIVAN